MQPGTDRILTAHAGSLPKPAELLSMVYAHERGEPVGADELAVGMRTAVDETVRKQLDAGVDMVNDGEVAKPSFATYVKDRLTGFGGEGSIMQLAPRIMDLDQFPDFAERVPALAASVSGIRYTSCDGPVSFTGQDAVQTDIDNLKASAAGAAPPSAAQPQQGRPSRPLHRRRARGRDHRSYARVDSQSRRTALRDRHRNPGASHRRSQQLRPATPQSPIAGLSPGALPRLRCSLRCVHGVASYCGLTASLGAPIDDLNGRVSAVAEGYRTIGPGVCRRRPRPRMIQASRIPICRA
jgi:hypothetical protein